MLFTIMSVQACCISLCSIDMFVYYVGTHIIEWCVNADGLCCVLDSCI